MSILTDLKMYWRFATGLRSFLRHTISLDEAREIIRRRMAEREINFLRLVERGIFGYRRSPYIPLLKLARIEFGDIRKMVGAKGLEETLSALKEAGVYITFEEFKGRQPIVRQGETFAVRAADFSNPHLSHYYESRTGGTTGVGTRVDIDLDHLADRAPQELLRYHARGTLDMPEAICRGVLPDGTAIKQILCGARIGHTTQKWFTPVTSRDLQPALRYRLGTRYIILAGRFWGASIPEPEPVRLDQAIVIARWVTEALKVCGACFVSASTSMALRICLAAREAGLDLSGAIFSGGAEQPTPAKVREITSMGARCFPSYHFVEAGIVGASCMRPVDTNDQHLFKDHLALTQHPRRVPGTDITVDAFYFTTLLPSAPKIMLNVESDDYGIVETRSCGCPLEDYGFTEHLRQICSFGKLTSEGVTLVGSEMGRILEEVLPAKFGGSPLDYQLAEEEDDAGFTRLNLRISPKIEISDEARVIHTVWEALSQSSVAADLARAHWVQANTLRVKRIEPIWTARGKLLPLHLGKRAEASPPTKIH